MLVVDEGGRLIAFGRMDQARPMSVDIAVNKAYTAASFQVLTSQLTAVAGQSWFQSMIVSSHGKIIAIVGGLPVLDTPNIVGAAQRWHRGPRPGVLPRLRGGLLTASSRVG